MWVKKPEVKTGSALELPGYYRGEKKWDLIVVSEGQLILAMEFKSQVGPSFGNNFNNRSEEVLGSATCLWTAFREGRLGTGGPAPFLGYLFLLEDCPEVHKPVRNSEPHFAVDPASKGDLIQKDGRNRFMGVSYCRRYELLCRRLILERLYTSACLLLATGTRPTRISQPAADLSFRQFVAALRGHVATVLGARA
ncbi:MAG: restriction endonuclease [Acidobacteria bacterium]|nr:restriction endonuclease [Acidobacteriota bacterium]